MEIILFYFLFKENVCAGAIVVIKRNITQNI